MPSCGWAPARLLSGLLGDPVSAASPSWGTQIAPVLSCSYLERTPSLQVAGAPLAVVEFREQQIVKPPKGAVSVPHLGSCISEISCPVPGQPAWLVTASGLGVAAGASSAQTFVKLAALEVEDGFNEITIVIANPQAPLPVENERRALESLARRLLPRFYWAGKPGEKTDRRTGASVA